MPSRRQLAVAAGYVAAAALYIAIGVWLTDFLLSVFVGTAYLLLVAWLVPAGVRRLF
jgi:branched-subunit amino acid transport protein AzlD